MPSAVERTIQSSANSQLGRRGNKLLESDRIRAQVTWNH